MIYKYFKHLTPCNVLKSIYCFVYLEYKIKKFGSMLRSTSQISFSKLYMERSTRR
ncbi:MAG: hypothetical protein ACMUEL_00665 [Flavobacteriales bacterium Tduv]